jgi:hypothetical protein
LSYIFLDFFIAINFTKLKIIKFFKTGKEKDLSQLTKKLCTVFLTQKIVFNCDPEIFIPHLGVKKALAKSQH